MSDVIDWSKAPEGATHYYHNGTGRGVCSHWIRACGKGRYWIGMLRFSKLWQEDTSPVDLRHAIALPNPTPWSGEGLPPVGAVCEYNAMPIGKPEKWHKVEVVYVSGWVIVLRCIEAPDGHEAGNGVEIAVAVDSGTLKDIRPIRTHEQIAADEREAAISEMFGSISFSDHREAKRICAELYDSGFRKP